MFTSIMIIFRLVFEMRSDSSSVLFLHQHTVLKNAPTCEHRARLCPGLFRQWTTATPRARSESCCTLGHFVCLIDLFLLVMSLNTLVSMTCQEYFTGFILNFRHEFFQLVQYLHCRVSWTHVPFGVFRLTQNVDSFLQLSLFIPISVFFLSKFLKRCLNP